MLAARPGHTQVLCSNSPAPGVAYEFLSLQLFFLPFHQNFTSNMNPYLSNPDDIPASDQYADLVSYGRYLPRPNDFRVLATQINSQSAASLKYWASVLGLRDDSNMICPGIDDGRDVFALGSVIVKSNHLHHTSDEQQHHATEIDYSYADANEMQAIGLARTVLTQVKTPEIYFSGKVCIDLPPFL